MAWDTGSEPESSSASTEYETRNPDLLFFLQRQMLVSWQPSLPFFPLSSPADPHHHHHQRPFLDLQKGAHCCLVVGRALAER